MPLADDHNNPGSGREPAVAPAPAQGAVPAAEADTQLLRRERVMRSSEQRTPDHPPISDTPSTGPRVGEPNDAIAELRDEVQGLRTALETRGVIEQAKGIMMAKSGCTAEEAFEALRHASQRSNRKVRDIAADVVVGVGHRARAGFSPAGLGTPTSGVAPGSVPLRASDSSKLPGRRAH